MNAFDHFECWKLVRLMPVIIKIRYDVKKRGKNTRYKSNVYYTNSEMPEAFYFWIRNWYATLISNDGKSTENKYKNIPKWSFKMRSNERKESCGRCLLLLLAACLFNIPFICCFYYFFFFCVMFIMSVSHSKIIWDVDP